MNRLRRGAVLLALATITSAAACGGRPATTNSPVSAAPGSPTIAARNLAFDRTTLTVTANVPFTLVFQNWDARRTTSRSTPTPARRTPGSPLKGPTIRDVTQPP
ncbi:MAG TPA: hypothetical protein VKR30_03830 [Candidatus Limnocylindrales bacterium]|nr:hypothetical protein [Candidatus Limnocylindrales bacterium]